MVLNYTRWKTKIYILVFQPSDTTWSLLTVKCSYLISNATWTPGYFLLITIILNYYGRAVWREGPDSIIVPQDGNISSCNTVAMFSSPSIALFFVKLSVGWKEWMNKGKTTAHNLPLHGRPLIQGNLCAFYTKKRRGLSSLSLVSYVRPVRLY